MKYSRSYDQAPHLLSAQPAGFVPMVAIVPRPFGGAVWPQPAVGATVVISPPVPPPAPDEPPPPAEPAEPAVPAEPADEPPEPPLPPEPPPEVTLLPAMPVVVV